MPLQAVAYFAALKRTSLGDLPVRHKKAPWTRLVRLDPAQLAPIEFSPGTVLHVDELAGEAFETAVRYKELRDAHIVSDTHVLGGTPVICGTRMSVYAVLGRLQNGDDMDDLAAENPNIPRDAFEAAAIFAWTHPLRGRPGGRPWRNAARQSP